ncbi:hypothetical protein [Cognatishimia maritima]|uniref:DNA repair protein n=1 Tax=Cognatishimia maritima TaxID=870908 RepID=A0A1M5J4K9_9RHOB|nr:hypothetical protein [Cognatishimia maritima]SHG35305.1 hypothetical protein SAMN04488044_0540 [Cognatishimia maritima]
MGTAINSIALTSVRLLQTLTLAALVVTMLAMLAWTALATFGILPWLGMDLTIGTNTIDDAGRYVQVGLTVLSIGLCVFLPANARIMQLETSHRKFSVKMQDVAQAYQVSHRADRKGAFGLSDEFDAVRERLIHLRDHPDLGDLEPEILELAAQMSYQSRSLAETYSDEKVERAMQFLKQRQEEAHRLEDRLAAARQTCDELRRWVEDVEAEERLASQHISRLEADLMELLPRIGYELDGDPTVVKLDSKSAKNGKHALKDSRPPKRLS